MNAPELVKRRRRALVWRLIVHRTLRRWLAIALARLGALLLARGVRLDHHAVREDQSARILAQISQRPISLSVVADADPAGDVRRAAAAMRMSEQMAWQTRHPSTFPGIVNPS